MVDSGVEVIRSSLEP